MPALQRACEYSYRAVPQPFSTIPSRAATVKERLPVWQSLFGSGDAGLGERLIKTERWSIVYPKDHT